MTHCTLQERDTGFDSQYDKTKQNKNGNRNILVLEMARHRQGMPVGAMQAGVLQWVWLLPSGACSGCSVAGIKPSPMMVRNGPSVPALVESPAPI